MIARTQMQTLQPVLSSASGADGRIAVVLPVDRGHHEQRLGTGREPAWGILTSVPASAVARRRRSEEPHESHGSHEDHSKPAVANIESETALRDRMALA